MKRGKEVAKISLIETKKGFEMNEVCQKKIYFILPGLDE